MDNKIFFDKLKSESEIVIKLLSTSKLHATEQQKVVSRSKDLINKIKADKRFSMEGLLHRYSLSYDEGVAVLGLAEGLLRIPDHLVAKELARDKLSDKNWGSFLFKKSNSIKTILASFGLYFAGKFSDLVKLDNILSNLFDRIGQPIFIKALKESILFLSREFVFACDVKTAITKTSKYPDFKFSFDLLGESARTTTQADTYYRQYNDAIIILSNAFPYNGEALEERPNLSVKLTALYPRVELLKLKDLEKILLPKLVDLVEKIKNNNLTITFDAEEASRNDTYLLLLTQLIMHPSFKNFEGIGLVVQAYQTRTYQIIEYIISLAKKSGKKIPIRLVKGAYWDTEIKHAQEIGMENYPVFTKKEYTDLSYIACARLILENDKFIYPQFATHNAVTAASIIELAGNKKYEFQKLYGMGNTLHETLAKHRNIRIYAPVGNTKDLLAYLIRRMLENGASANFVSKVHSNELKISDMVYDINDKVLNLLDNKGKINLPKDIYPDRTNAMGYDLGYKTNYDYIQEKVASYYDQVHKVGSIINGAEIISSKHEREVFCPGKNAEKFASVSDAVESEIKAAIDSAHIACDKWSNLSVQQRAQILRNIAQAFEDNKFELYALLIKEAGKSIHDAINEVIEAVDFCRYYANQAEYIMQEKTLPGATGESNVLSMHARGVFLCISPWNFPFAIFIGQIVAALATGNTVIAKPSGQTTVVANFAVKLMHKTGVTKSALQLIITSGSNISKYVVSDERIAGVVFTGSCGAAKAINTTLASRNSGIIPFIAETGGQNAMIVDSSALLEQVTDTVLTSAFYSAGQRCSALRMLYVQEEIYDELLELIKEATELLEVGDTSKFNIDIGPVIDNNSKDTLSAHIDYMTQKGFKVAAHPHSGKQTDGHYFYPHVIEVKSINDIPDEKFGPILHITKYKANKLDKVIAEINNCGFGLTFGVHSRIEEKIEYIRSKVKVGNFYANRSITGAKVESQPFGGENKSGTGFKAGGPNYLLRFMTERTTTINTTAFGGNIELLNS
ncbi:MAG: bifunctional proline dehydrogenase/L-glutamate gamma-semialdehyde dehydrogenase PutA [Rickettsiaceae bacterium]|nr:bifunctional proline dehydrogenase/L-glutamate gamma-semialdehyde dehydrogenase PutA [Rickettsiaceae bacterium]